jgi:hypothetical protein
MNLVFEATLSALETQRKEALAELSVYFLRTNEYDKSAIIDAVKKLNEAEGCIETLMKNFIEENNEQQDNISG